MMPGERPSLSTPSSLPRLFELSSVLKKLNAPYIAAANTNREQEYSFSHTKEQKNALLTFRLRQKIRQQKSPIVSHVPPSSTIAPPAAPFRQRSYPYEIPQHHYDEDRWRKKTDAQMYPYVHSYADVSTTSPYYLQPRTETRRYQGIQLQKEVYSDEDDNTIKHFEESAEDEETAYWEFEDRSSQNLNSPQRYGRAERRKAQCRRNQARYRSKRKAYEASLPKLLGNLRCEIQELLEIRTQLIMQAQQPVTKDYQPLFQEHQQYPQEQSPKKDQVIQIIQQIMGLFTESDSCTLHEETLFSSLEMEKNRENLRQFMREDAHFNGKMGIDAFLHAKRQIFRRFHQIKWKLETFQDDCHPHRFKSEDTITTTNISSTTTRKHRVIRVYGKLSFKMTYDIIRTSFPYLIYEEESNAKCFRMTPPDISLIQVLVGNIFDCPMQMIFEMDEQNKVASMIYELDFIQPLLYILKNPKLVAFVLSGTR
jgi:hypothetical protein